MPREGITPMANLGWSIEQDTDWYGGRGMNHILVLFSWFTYLWEAYFLHISQSSHRKSHLCWLYSLLLSLAQSLLLRIRNEVDHKHQQICKDSPGLYHGPLSWGWDESRTVFWQCPVPHRGSSQGEWKWEILEDVGLCLEGGSDTCCV